MVDQFDYLAIMAYRNAAGRIYEISQRTLNEADRQKKRVWVGVELGKRHGSFAGIAVHSYEAWHRKLSGP